MVEFLYIISKIFSVQFSFFALTQAGFRQSLSTVDHLYLLQRAIRDALRKKRQLPVVFLDIVKAFDRVPHDRLLYKLCKQAGITGKAWIWLQAFLSNRSFRVTQGAYRSSFVSASAGVPQGAVLSPLLFIIYINDLALNCPLRIHQSMFADDVAAWPVLQRYDQRVQYSELNDFVGFVSAWSEKWLLHFSPDKSALVTFHHRTPARAPKPSTLPFKLCSGKLVVQDSYKYLGHLLHRSSRFNDHLAAIVQKARLTAYYIGRVTSRTSLPSPSTICRIVKAVLIPQITYGFAFLDLTRAFCDKITQVIAAPLRKALGLPIAASGRRVLWEYGLYDVETLHLKHGIAALMRSQRCLKRGVALAGSLASDFDGLQSIKSAKYCRPRARQVQEMLTSLGLARVPADPSELKTALDARSRVQYMGSVLPKVLALKPQLPQLPYLTLDSKPAVCIRARVRLGVALSFDKLHRYRKRDDDLCDHCGRVTRGTVMHLLLACPHFQTARAICEAALAADGFALSLDVLCGLLPSHTRKKLIKRVHDATAVFLLQVSKRHGFL
jgi:hypothetical protein